MKTRQNGVASSRAPVIMSLATRVAYCFSCGMQPATVTRALLLQGNRAKPCKFRYVKPVGNFIRHSDRRRKLAFSTPALSFDSTSAANSTNISIRLISPETTDRTLRLHLCCWQYTRISVYFKTIMHWNQSVPAKWYPLEKQYLTQNGYSRSFKVICFKFSMSMKSHWGSTYSDIKILVSNFEIYSDHKKKNKKAQLTQGLCATAPSFQDGRQPPSWILSNRK